MRRDVERDWERANAYFPAIEKILRSIAGHFLIIEVADMDADMKRATDYMLRVDGGDMAVRVRTPSYKDRYRDWTIRASRASGAETELSKLRDGHGRWYFYGWGKSSTELADWVLIDLDAVRACGILNDEWPLIPNVDGVTWFIAIPVYNSLRKPRNLERLGLITASSQEYSAVVAPAQAHSPEPVAQPSLFDAQPGDHHGPPTQTRP